jgi:hypothetical protein
MLCYHGFVLASLVRGRRVRRVSGVSSNGVEQCGQQRAENRQQRTESGLERRERAESKEKSRGNRERLYAGTARPTGPRAL